MRNGAFLATAAAAAALASGGAAATGTTTIVFGRTGGNIAPSSITIAGDGSVTAEGPLQRGVKASTVSPAELARLRALVVKERFFALPAQIRCPGALPDFAARYVTVTTGPKTRTITVQGGGCGPRFDTLYKSLVTVVGTG